MKIEFYFLINTMSIVSVDIETTGSKFANKVISVGFAIGDDKGNIISLKQFNLEFDNNDFEKRCYDEFWSKHLDKLAELKQHAVPQPKGWNAINDYINDMEKLGKVKFVSDNASFDLAFINYNLERYCDRTPMRYSSSGRYRAVVAPDDMLNMLSDEKNKELTRLLNEKYPPNHNPVNDAINIYYQYIIARIIKNNQDLNLDFKAIVDSFNKVNVNFDSIIYKA